MTVLNRVVQDIPKCTFVDLLCLMNDEHECVTLIDRAFLDCPKMRDIEFDNDIHL